MRGKEEECQPTQKKKITILFFLVIFVFAILLVSMAVASIILYVLDYFSLMQPLSSTRLPIVLAFLFVVSLVVALLITVMAGKRSLKPFERFIEATKEISAGNFDVRVETHGPEEIDKLALSFNEMAEELGSIEALRDDFVSSISHEYKTPIVSIQGFAKLLKRNNLPKEKHDEYLDIILMESQRLTALSDKVLLLSRLSSTESVTEIDEFSLDEQIRRVVLLMNEQIEARNLDISIDLETCLISSSEELLQQVWINLLSNAIKFSPDEGVIDLTLSSDGELVSVSISDRGSGMESDTVKHIFDKFYQGDSSRSFEGNGLGLALVQRIVELCQGQITVQSTVGKGSTFTVLLPCSLSSSG